MPPQTWLAFIALVGLTSNAQEVHARLSDCEVSTIKPVNPQARTPVGPRVYPNGRITIGRATVRDLIELSQAVEEFQVEGGPEWAAKDRFDVMALCPKAVPGTGTYARGYSFTLSAAQRQVVRELLSSRFQLKMSQRNVAGSAFLLLRTKLPLAMTPTSKPDLEPAMSVMQKGAVVDGEAFAINATMDDIAREFYADLQKPVVNKTGIIGPFDFHVKPFDPENRDLDVAVFAIAKRLGLELRKGSASYPTFKITSVSKPDEN